ncbi:MAG: hypothetical protein M3R40_02075 [Pseudomonadota bacterium]|nr:hypothetical protein [Pseudomonadota bacterium]
MLLSVLHATLVFLLMRKVFPAAQLTLLALGLLILRRCAFAASLRLTVSVMTLRFVLPPIALLVALQIAILLQAVVGLLALVTASLPTMSVTALLRTHETS